MDMRYIKYVFPKEKYYKSPEEKVEDESKFNVPSHPEFWETRFNSHWTYCFPSNNRLPIQGWKIHISASSSEAQQTLDIVSTFLFDQSVSFKYVSSLSELFLKNSKYGDRGSSGKFITIYPIDESQFLFLLDHLHKLLKDIPNGPYVLSDKRWLDGNVYFRYGAFEEMHIKDGASTILAIKTPSGEYIPDSRGISYVIPDFVDEPKAIQDMTKDQEKMQSSEDSQLNSYDIKSALHFSNGGGVYLADHIDSGKQVVLKEGRPGAGLDGIGRDAIKRLKHEAAILEHLKGIVNVVQYRGIFQEWEHIFLVEEYIPGNSLKEWVASFYPFSRSQDPIEYLESVIPIIKQLKKAVEDIHSRGIGIGDLQPSNVMITHSNRVKLIDFEAASDDLADTKHSGLMTPGFTGAEDSTREQIDWFALLRIARYVFVPIGPVQDMSECILKKHDQWILKQFGEEAIMIIEDVEAECRKRSVKPMVSILSSPVRYYDKDDLPQVISKLRNGIVNDLREGIRLLPGDTRQFESSSGLLNVLTGGFGVVMALVRTGTLPKKAREWAVRFSDLKYINQLDDGLFSGKAGIAGVLHEIGMRDESKAIYDSIQIQLESEDISLRTGLAGIGLSLLSASTLSGFETLFEKAVAIGYRLQTLLERDVSIKPNELDAIPFGLIEGWSGVSLFFSALHWNTGDENWLTLSMRAIEKDTNHYVFEDTGLYQLKDDSHLVPQLAGGSSGVGLAMIELRHLLKNNKWNDELRGIGMYATQRCIYSPGLFRGLAGLIIGVNAVDKELDLQDDKAYLTNTLETMNLYLLGDENKLFVPGDFNYRLSGDIFSGASGMMLALSEVNSYGFTWLPLPNISRLFPSYCNTERSNSVLKGGDFFESNISSSTIRNQKRQ
ncbi:class III lanthionine synthetase LanKC [Chengkuizengella sediminis]|uniref:class III lanthionine synthetase LanKC n=1 Tax=Chengkuizengella sediminis TaxID=1885917 RepID=UPI00138A1AB0|nr:class III lanthionine synthetase LanKC [Chengkuizengella sediminis]NDI35799.1 protein kinase/lanthionine synthetase C family protein [Chengkuizengella sediminis]